MPTVGVPREIKTGETRVALTPSLCRRLCASGAEVRVEYGAGATAGFADAEYTASGAVLVDAATAYASDIVLKVKEVLPQEFARLREGSTLFTYLHLAPNPELARVLVERHVLAIGYETVESADGALPLLKPMSQIAGRLAVQIGAYFLQSQQGGSGVLLGGVPGTAPGRVAIIGAGNSGAHACRIALGMGARVTLLDINAVRLEQIDDMYEGRLVTLMSNPGNLERIVPDTDLLIAAVLVPAARAPIVVSRSLVQRMRPGSVIVDIAIDQGGCIEGIHPTSHDAPVYSDHGVLHYAVPNMPAMVGRTSTIALTQATEPFVAQLVEKGVARALEENRGLAKGINTREGKVVHPAVARALGMA
jgi:alanine dehydrogenase